MFNLKQDNFIPKNLPILDYLDQRYKLKKTKPFKGRLILAVQHLLGSAPPFFKMLEKGGAKPADIFIVGKAYSSHPQIVKRLQDSGYQLSFQQVFDCYENRSYDSLLKKHILQSAKNLFLRINKNQKGLLIDDGGKAIKLLHHYYKERLNQFSCVEQTSRGARNVQTLDKIKCPVINVARSKAKTLCESPAIAKSMVGEFITTFKKCQKTGIIGKAKKIVLLGYGFIGQNVVKELKKFDFDLKIYDPDKASQEKKKENKLNLICNLNQNLRNADIIIGCTGTSVLQKRQFYNLKKGVILANMASTDLEFSAWSWRPKGEIVWQNILDSDLEYLKDRMPLVWRSLYRVPVKNSYFYLFNGGFPTDFSGKINPVPLSDIQLTSGLLLAGAIQAVETHLSGLIRLNQTTQNLIIKKLNPT